MLAQLGMRSASKIRLLEFLLIEKNERPARTRHHMDGRTSLVWFAGDDRDRYVEVGDSVRGEKLVLLCRDGDRGVEAYLEGSERVAAEWVVSRMRQLAGSPREDEIS